MVSPLLSMCWFPGVRVLPFSSSTGPPTASITNAPPFAKILACSWTTCGSPKIQNISNFGSADADNVLSWVEGAGLALKTTGGED